ncbi:hypothetical protein ACIGXM_14600 [Kitasatospora sp. NPDC052896]|uniref:hypothetical protein n=1 Tax=Kitasatospora sp. NPDC052896 TaxID=3364061 RepID=UPI0037C9D10A
MSEWFDSTAGVVLMNPYDIKVGMRLADWRIANERQETVLTPLWTKSYDVGPQGGPWGRTSDGQHHSWKSFGLDSGVLVWVHPEIREEFMPPYPGDWITNTPPSMYAMEYLDGSRVLRTEVIGDRTYTLRRKAERNWGRASWVIREENGQTWWSPSREAHDLAEAQFDAIVSGKGW